jgi:DNA topoisomerase IA
LLKKIEESEVLDERTLFEKLGLIDYDRSDLQEIKAENDLKVKNYIDSLNNQQR